MLEKKTVSQCISPDYCKGWNDAVDAISVKHGRWIHTELTRNLGIFIGVECSQCGYEKIGAGYQHCPSCGARMDMEDNEDGKD